MTRSMGDAIHDNVAALKAAHTQMVAGYLTGTTDIRWTTGDWAQFPGIPHVTIDQGAYGSPVMWADVRDVEPGAWQPQNAVVRTGWTAKRPTIYCNRNDLSREGGVLGCGWKGDIWLAYPGWQTGQPLPTAPGCTYVAVQNQLGAGGNRYDLSVVLDNNWPQEAQWHLPHGSPERCRSRTPRRGRCRSPGWGRTTACTSRTCTLTTARPISARCQPR